MDVPLTGKVEHRHEHSTWVHGSCVSVHAHLLGSLGWLWGQTTTG